MASVEIKYYVYSGRPGGEIHIHVSNDFAQEFADSLLGSPLAKHYKGSSSSMFESIFMLKMAHNVDLENFRKRANNLKKQLSASNLKKELIEPEAKFVSRPQKSKSYTFLLHVLLVFFISSLLFSIIRLFLRQ